MARARVAHLLVIAFQWPLAVRALLASPRVDAALTLLASEVIDPKIISGDGPPAPTLSSQEISCLLKQAVYPDEITLFGSNQTLQSVQVTRNHPTHWRTCSIVSSSGVVTLNNHSKAIDAADAVMHFNTAPLKGYEASVGYRDDIRFVNNQFARLMLDNSTALNLSDTTMYINVLPTLADSVGRRQAKEFRELMHAHPHLRMFTTPNTLQHRVAVALHHIYSNEWFSQSGVNHRPTSGAVGMVLAMSMCDIITSYGMAASRSAYSARHHYYDDEGTVASEQYYHKSFTAEKDLWRRLSVTPVADIDSDDIATIPGFSNYDCTGVAKLNMEVELEESHAVAVRIIIPTLIALSSILLSS